MRIRLSVVVFSVAIVLAVPTSAEEILHLTGGGTMVIRSHRVENGMIHVDLGGNALMAFPAASVEKISAAGKDVYVSPSYQRANIAGGTGDVRPGGESIVTSAPITGEGSVPSRFRGDRRSRALNAGDSAAGVSATAGDFGTVPAAGLPSRRLRVAGSRDAWGGSSSTTDYNRGSMSPNLGGKVTLPSPMAPSSSAPGIEVRRMWPSDKLADAAVAEGQPAVPEGQPPTEPDPSDPSGE